MKKTGWFGFVLLIVILLTILTQVGGLVFLASLPLLKQIRYKINSVVVQIIAQIFVALSLYMVCTFGIVPPLARLGGRVPLPIHHSALKPRNIVFCLLNRHYVTPTLKATAIGVAQQLQQQYKGTVLVYLDAGFPFFDGFPLVPHLSHNDGKKLDLAFFYRSQITQQASNTTPSFMGYGICEKPQANEENYAAQCANKGYWQYNWVEQITPQASKLLFTVDVDRTKAMVQAFAQQPNIGKIFLEPHLKKRWHLDAYNNIRLHGCQAVRHDDHLHVQLK